MRYRGVSEASHLSTRQGAIQLAPSRRGTSSERLAGRGYGIVFDPCGRTSRYECDRKGRWVYGLSITRQSSALRASTGGYLNGTLSGALVGCLLSDKSDEEDRSDAVH